MEKNAQTGCCPKFDPEPWKEKEVSWNDKLFFKDHFRSFFHVPVNLSGVIKKDIEKIESAGAENPDSLMLMREESLWGGDLLFAVDKEIPGAQLEKISGKFMTEVFEGPYKDAGKWAKQAEESAKSKGKEIKGMYFWYTTCPKCAKFYGKNYAVIFTQV